MKYTKYGSILVWLLASVFLLSTGVADEPSAPADPISQAAAVGGPGDDPDDPGAGEDEERLAEPIRPWQEYANQISASQMVSALGSDLFGENVSLYSGQTEFSNVDIDLPGTGLPVQLRRRFTVQPSGAEVVETYGGFGNWDVDVPYMSGVFDGANPWRTASNPNRCSTNFMPSVNSPFKLSDVWSGNSVHIPGHGEKDVLALDGSNPHYPADGTTHRWTTRDFDSFTCISRGTSGEGFKMRTPDGVSYTFDVEVHRNAGRMGVGTSSLGRTKVHLLASRVEDRHGNFVDYTYNGDGRPTKIQASDGRTIILTYAAQPSCSSASAQTCSRISTATAHGRTWTYQYEMHTRPHGPRLTGVTLPNQSTWSYVYAADLYVNYESWDGNSNATCTDVAAVMPATFSLTATHPSGAVGTFNFSHSRHYRSGVGRSNCVGTSDGSTTTYRLKQSNYFDVYGLQTKTIAGPGIVSPMAWTYAYGGGFEPLLSKLFGSSGINWCTTCTMAKEVLVTQPDASKKRYRFGILYGLNEGRLLGTDTLTSAGAVVRSESNVYVSETEVASELFPVRYGAIWGSGEPSSARVRPIRSTSITQQAVTFTSHVNQFDAFARPLSTTQSSSLGARTERSTYYDDLSKWVLGQIATVSMAATPSGAATTMVSNTYHASSALPWKESRFGQLQRTLEYHGDGNLHRIRDGLDQTTTLTNYWRGIPRSVSYANGSSESALVNDFGQITSHTNAAGFATAYQYDGGGFLNKITHPSSDTVAWNATTRVFEKVTTPEMGSLAHWRLTESTGNGRSVTWLDAFWRPMLTRAYDSADPNNTSSMVLKKFDAESRTVFESYPQRNIASVTASPHGTTSTYDALGRLTQSVADSELGGLATVIAYKAGFEKQVTNPRNKITRSWYKAFHEPSEEWPVSITAPEGVSVSIARDLFGKPISLQRSGAYAGGSVSATRSYVYDPAQRLCKVIEPESGATIVDYNAANNVLWSAAGQALTSTSDCQRGSVAASAKASHSYDALNRLLTTSYADGSPGIARTWTPDGLPATVTSDGSQWSYGYNKRRLLEQELLTLDGQLYGLTWGYDANGQRKQLTYPDGEVVAYNPNALGQPRQIGTHASALSYYANGSVAGFTYGNGIVRTMTPNLRGLPTRSKDQGVLNDVYSYDANANVVGIVDEQQALTTRSLGYDGLDRLTTASGVWGSGAFSYDPLDNLRTSTIGARSFTHQINATTQRLDALKAGASTVMAYAYDGRGNVTQRGTQGFQFDLANRISAATGTASYRYDGLGRRTLISENSGAGRVQVYSQAGQLLHEVDTQTDTATNYVYLGSTLLARGKVTASLPAPASFSATPNPSTTGAYTLSWSAVTGATHYVLTEQVGSSWPERSSGSARTFAVSGKPNGSYTYRVVACQGSACSSASQTLVSVNLGVELPPAPTSLSATPNPSPNGSYSVSWVLGSGGLATDKYTLEEKPAGGSFTPIASLTSSTTWPVSGRSAGDYLYQVKSCRASGTPCSAMSAPLSVTVSAGSAPPAPATITGVTHCKPSPRTYTIKWSGVTGATRYDVEEKVDASTTYQTLTTVTGTSAGFNRTSTVEGQYHDTVMYSYRVRACNGGGCSPWKGTAHACVGNALRPALVLSSQVTYLHTDALGSPVAETNASGTVTRRMHYEPYGAPTTGNYTDGPAFTGHVQDAVTGLTYMQQRYYDPLAGRFLSVDPVPASVTSFNRYWYANNNAYKFTDPDGRLAMADHPSLKGDVQTIQINPQTASDRATEALAYMNKKIPELSTRHESPEKAKNAFGKAFARKSKELGVEFGANIIAELGKVLPYFLTDFQISTTFIRPGLPYAGYARGVPIPGRPNDPSYWGFVHTHWRNDGDFSVEDRIMARERAVNAYVIFPDGSSEFHERGN